MRYRWFLGHNLFSGGVARLALFAAVAECWWISTNIFLWCPVCTSFARPSLGSGSTRRASGPVLSAFRPAAQIAPDRQPSRHQKSVTLRARVIVSEAAG